MIFLAGIGFQDEYERPGIERHELHDSTQVGSFDEARSWLLGHLRAYEADSCLDCEQRAAEAVASLRVATGPMWQDNVEGSDYWIEPLTVASQRP